MTNTTKFQYSVEINYIIDRFETIKNNSVTTNLV